MVKKSAVCRGVQDGLLSATFLFILDELICSELCVNGYTWYLYALIIAALLSTGVFLLFANFMKGNVFRYYGVGRLSLIISLVILLVNDLVFHIHLFPRRAISNVDGLVLFVVHGAYLLFTELLRLALSVLIFLYKKHQARTE